MKCNLAPWITGVGKVRTLSRGSGVPASTSHTPHLLFQTSVACLGKTLVDWLNYVELWLPLWLQRAVPGVSWEDEEVSDFMATSPTSCLWTKALKTFWSESEIAIKTASEVWKSLEEAGEAWWGSVLFEGWSWSPDSKLRSSWVWVCSPMIPALWLVEARGSGVQAQPRAHSESLFERTNE